MNARRKTLASLLIASSLCGCANFRGAAVYFLGEPQNRAAQEDMERLNNGGEKYELPISYGLTFIHIKFGRPVATTNTYVARKE